MNTNLEEFVSKIVAQMGYELVDFEFQNQGKLIRIFIDKPASVTIDDCVDVSNHLNHVLTVEEDIDYERLPKMFVDTASRPGMSGSPVIFRRTGIHGAKNGELKPDSIIGTIQNFVGIYSGRVLGKTELEAQLGIVWKKEVIDEIIDGNTKDEKNVW